jgi:hypothetical protein
MAGISPESRVFNDKKANNTGIKKILQRRANQHDLLTAKTPKHMGVCQIALHEKLCWCAWRQMGVSSEVLKRQKRGNQDNGTINDEV